MSDLPALPALALKTVFDFMSIPEKFRMRLVCKTWRFVVDNLYSQQNVCIYSTSYPFNRRWCFSDQPVLEGEMLYRKFNPEPDPNFHLRQPFFRGVRKLFIHRVGPQIDVFLAEVDQLTNLKELKIDDYRIKTRKLSSSSLERLSLYVQRFEFLELETPNLNSYRDLSSRNQRQTVKFSFPLAVRHLECREFHESYSQLENLETLCCWEVPLNLQLDEFKSLTKLEIFPKDKRELPVVRGLQSERARLGRDHLQMIISGFREQLIICDSIASTDHKGLMLGPAYLQQVLQNPSKLVAPISRKFNIDASTLLEWVDLIPNFFEKFRIDTISTERSLTELQQCHLAKLIRQSRPRCLNTLNRLKREFYQKISLCESIKILNMGPPAVRIDYNQLLNLRNLEVLCLQYYHSTKKVPLDFISKLFVQLKFLCEFDFHSKWGKGGSRITICYEIISPEYLDNESYPQILPFPYVLSYGEEQVYVTDEHFCNDVKELTRKIYQIADHEVIRNCLVF